MKWQMKCETYGPTAPDEGSARSVMVYQCPHNDPNCLGSGSHSTTLLKSEMCPSAYTKKLKRHSKMARKIARNRIKWAKEYLGNRCAICGTSGNDTPLEFDHINPETKDFEINQGQNRRKEVFRKELDKCQLLCKLCHQAKSSQEASQRATAKQDQLKALLNQYESEAA